MNVTMSAEATQSQAMCGNEVVSVPEKGRMDIVTRPLLVKVGQVKCIYKAHLKTTHADLGPVRRRVEAKLINWPFSLLRLAS